MKTNNLYPIFLKLDKINTLIVGGGNVGLEKVQFILRQSPQAKIKVVSKEFHAEIIRLAIDNTNIKLAEKNFETEDLDGKKIVIIATNNNLLNACIYQLAQKNNILTNVVDNPELCDFYTGAIMKKGPVKIAVSSNGVSPTLAKRLRDIFEEVIPDEIEESAEQLKQIRAQLKGNLATKINTLNSITSVLSNDLNKSKSQFDSSFLQHINLN